MHALFYDTETTGLPLFREPSEHPGQPHIVQLAAALVNMETRATVASIDVIVRPDGWTIPDQVAAIHGITTERAMDEGVPEPLALDMLLDLWGGRRLRIAHNEPFDARIVRIAAKRHRADMADPWEAGKAECTAQMATPILKLPPTPKMIAAGFTKFKTANLGEAYQHFLGKQLEDAHSAMPDVQACMAVYFAIKEREAVPA
jgi:DNA polymerase-3 subunit epsilon